MKKRTLNYFALLFLYFFCNGVYGANGSENTMSWKIAEEVWGVRCAMVDLEWQARIMKEIKAGGVCNGAGLCDEEAAACSEVVEYPEEMPDFRVLRRKLAQEDKKKLEEVFAASGLKEKSLRVAREQYYESTQGEAVNEFYFFDLIVHMSWRKAVKKAVCCHCGCSPFNKRSTFVNAYFPIADNDTSDKAKKYRELCAALQKELEERINDEDKFKRAMVWALPSLNLIRNVNCRRCQEIAKVRAEQ